MALTPEDVVNKRFQQTKFREGYDQDEVDDFLDEIVVELRRLIAENEELRRELDEALVQQSSRTRSEGGTESAASSAEPSATPAPQAFAAPAVEEEDETEATSSLLGLARRLYQEHVAEGARRRDEIVKGGEAKAHKLVSDAELTSRNITNEGEAKARQIVSDAEAREREVVKRLEETKARLEERIEELRVFEREYRNKLRAFIEGELNALNRQSQNIEPGAA